MAHFYGTIQGNKGQATRCGTKGSGLISTADGWDIGGRVEVAYSEELQTDIVYLYTTDGSNGRSYHKVASFAVIDGKQTLLDTNYPEIFI